MITKKDGKTVRRVLLFHKNLWNGRTNLQDVVVAIDGEVLPVDGEGQRGKGVDGVAVDRVLAQKVFKTFFIRRLRCDKISQSVRPWRVFRPRAYPYRRGTVCCFTRVSSALLVDVRLARIKHSSLFCQFERKDFLNIDTWPDPGRTSVPPIS